MTANQRIFENIYKMSEMAKAKADHVRDFINEFPEVLDVYKDPSHVKPGTPANEKWKKYIADFYEFYPDDALEGGKPAGKSFSDSIFPIVKRMEKAANAGKSDKTMSVEGIIRDLKSVQAKLSAANLADTGAYESVAMAIESLSVVLDDSETQDLAAMEGQTED